MVLCAFLGLQKVDPDCLLTFFENAGSEDQLPLIRECAAQCLVYLWSGSSLFFPTGEEQANSQLPTKSLVLDLRAA